MSTFSCLLHLDPPRKYEDTSITVMLMARIQVCGCSASMLFVNDRQRFSNDLAHVVYNVYE